MNREERKSALIIGASSGIGKEMALRLARGGWTVGVIGRRAELLREVAAAVPGRIVVASFDIDDHEKLEGRLRELAKDMGGVDLVVVGAGIGFLNPELRPEPEVATVSTNITAFTLIVDWAYTHFKERGGQIAAITSVGGLVSEASAPAYCASKAYQILYLDALAKRARKEGSGCAITELRPGSVDTAMMKGEGHFWISRPEAAAELACRAIMKKKRLQYISRRWRLIGFAARVLALFS